MTYLLLLSTQESTRASGRTRSTRLSEVLDSGTGVLAATEENSVSTLGGDESELIESQAFTTSLNDAGAGRFSEAEGSNTKLREVVTSQADVISDGTDNDGNLALLVLHVADKTSETQRRTVHAGHHKALSNNSIESAVSATSKELVELKNENIWFSTLQFNSREY